MLYQPRDTKICRKVKAAATRAPSYPSLEEKPILLFIVPPRAFPDPERQLDTIARHVEIADRQIGLELSRVSEMRDPGRASPSRNRVRNGLAAGGNWILSKPRFARSGNRCV